MDKSCDRRDQDWVRIQFTKTGKKTEVSRWIKGLKWGIKYYKYGGHGEHEGSILTIKLAVSTSSTAIGPNPVIHPQTPSIQDKGLGQRDEKMSTGCMPVPHARLSSPRGALAGTDGHIRWPTAGTHVPDPPVVVAGAVSVIAMGRVIRAAIALPVVLLVAVALVPVGYGTNEVRDKKEDPPGEVDEDTPLLTKKEKQRTPKVMLALAPPDDDNILDPTDQADLEEEAVKYNNENYPPKLLAPAFKKNPSSKNPLVRPSESAPISKTQRPPPFHPPPPRFDQKTPTGVRAALKQAEQEEDIEFVCYLIIFGREFDDESISWEPIP
ncbi:Leucine Zipper Tumor Suppressor 3-Like [Manis pentadactyla]|nr:Leucine Zipper Tumor Suppressor 3-Like [Manis pentadactyla]